MTLLYSDLDSKKVRRKRKIDLYFGYIFTIVLLAMVNMFYIVYFLYHSADYPLSNTIFLLVVWIIVMPILVWLCYYVFIKFPIMRLKYGITLTNEILKVLDSEIKLSSILDARILDFGYRSDFLGIIHTEWRKGKRKIRSFIIIEESTESIYELQQQINQLKGWPQQKSAMKISWKNWKKSYSDIPVGE
jgi:hypothetical protein